MGRKVLYILFLLSLIINSCKDKGFYEYSKSDWDLHRIPLIKPYEINSTNSGQTWGVMAESDMKFEGVLFGPSIDSVGISKKFIVFHTPEIFHPQGNFAAWLIFNTEKKKGFYIRNRKDYEEYLRLYKLDSIKLYDPKKIFNDFQYKLKLPAEWDSLVVQDKKERGEM